MVQSFLSYPFYENDSKSCTSNSTFSFAFTPTKLYNLVDQKDCSLLKRYGGINGLTKGFHTDTQGGSSGDETSPLKPITFKDNKKIWKRMMMLL